MKLNIRKSMAAALITAMVLSIVSPVALAQEPVAAEAKDEIVYVLSNAEGTSQQVIVSSWLQNPDHAAILIDQSNLSNIENVKGNETFTIGKDDILTWQANGHDIYYQGITDEAVPVEMNLSYTLDGKSIQPEKLAGKSGHVTICFDFTNHLTKDTVIHGKQEEICVPFAMMTALTLNPDKFHNVNVENGIVQNSGDQMIVMGITFPGMQESLGINTEDLNIPNRIQITTDVDCFEMGPSFTIGTSSVFAGLDSKKITIENLREQTNDLSEGVLQLADGAAQLTDGLDALLEKTGDLVSGIDQLSSGSVQLEEGLHTLSSGLSELNQNSSALIGGAKQVFEKLLDMANTQLKAAAPEVEMLTIDNYAAVLEKLMASLDPKTVQQAALQKVTEGVNEHRADITNGVTMAVRNGTDGNGGVRSKVQAAVMESMQAQMIQQIRAKVIADAVNGLSVEQYDAAVAAGQISEEQKSTISAAVQKAVEKMQNSGAMDSEEMKSQIEEKIEQATDHQMQTPEVQTMIEENVEAQIQKAIDEAMASDDVQTKIQAAAQGYQIIYSLKESLDSYNAFYQGIIAYTSGVSIASQGAVSLNNGATQLKDGLITLESYVGIANVDESTVNDEMTLISGMTQLRDGAKAISKGVNTLMEEGIQKIVDLVDNDLSQLAERFAAMINMAKEYKSFAGFNELTDGTVKFIYRIDAIEPQM